MLLNAVIFILSEVLEAAFIAASLLACWHHIGRNAKGFKVTLVIGALCALALALNFEHIVEMAEGMGQEVLNIILIFSILIALTAHAYFLCFNQSSNYLRVTGLLALVLAVILEGCEILIFGIGYASSYETALPILLGFFIGASVGVCIGMLLYYLIRYLAKVSWAIVFALLTVIAAGRTTEMTLYMIQSGLVDQTEALWNSSWLIDESSLVGRVLYAIIGYESTPTLLQAQAYLAVIAVFCFIYFLAASKSPRFIERNKF